ncbi:nuclear transport factor 2 family protein [Micromonospora maritima]|uniref:Nuclear transport factor 2 family protein n=1 Tax=Micromonospora maritima TaxID=986711 RepID=A0ABW7ZVB4_9ACTN
MSMAALARPAHVLIQHLFDVIDGQRWDELDEVFAPDCVYYRPGYPTLEGLPRLEHFYRAERVIRFGRHQVENIVSELSVAACWGRFRGTGKTGEALDEQFADTYVVNGGRIVTRKTFFFRPAI